MIAGKLFGRKNKILRRIVVHLNKLPRDFIGQGRSDFTVIFPGIISINKFHLLPSFTGTRVKYFT
jgi:hypothetical protein